MYTSLTSCRSRLLMLEVLFGLKPGRLGKNCYVIATHLASLTKQGVSRSRGKDIF